MTKRNNEKIGLWKFIKEDLPLALIIFLCLFIGWTSHLFWVNRTNDNDFAQSLGDKFRVNTKETDPFFA
jgi:hypothetical protein